MSEEEAPGRIGDWRDQGTAGQLGVCACVRWYVAAAGGQLQPRGLICPGASNWGDWGPGAAPGQTV